MSADFKETREHSNATFNYSGKEFRCKNYPARVKLLPRVPNQRSFHGCGCCDVTEEAA